MSVSKKDVLHFNEDLIEFNPNGDMNRLHTLQNHLKECVIKTYEKTYDVFYVMHVIASKCSSISEEIRPIYCYKFDNGIEIKVDSDGIQAIVHILTDADILK